MSDSSFRESGSGEGPGRGFPIDMSSVTFRDRERDRLISVVEFDTHLPVKNRIDLNPV